MTPPSLSDFIAALERNNQTKETPMQSDPSPFPSHEPPRSSSPAARIFRERDRHAAFTLRGAETTRRAPRARAWGRGKGVPR